MVVQRIFKNFENLELGSNLEAMVQLLNVSIDSGHCLCGSLIRHSVQKDEGNDSDDRIHDPEAYSFYF